MPPEQAAPQHPVWLVVNLLAQLAFGLLAMTICLPSMQDWPGLFNASQASVQLTFSGYIAAYGCLQLVHGAVSDRIGRKPVLMAGLLMACAGSVLAVLASELWVLIAARVLQGAGCAAGMVVGRAMVQDLFSGPERTRVMAFVGMTMGLCPPSALLIGGQLHVRLGWQANFIVMAVLALVLLLAAWRWLPAPRPQPRRPAGQGRSGWSQMAAGYGRLTREPAFLLYAAILALTAATFYAFLGGAPLVLAGYGVPPERIGLYIMAIPLSYIAGNLLTTRLIQRVGDRHMMLMGHIISVIGIALVLALGLAGVHAPLALSLPLVLLGIGHGFLMPPTLAGTVGLIPALAGSAAAVAGLLQQLIGALGGFAVGLVPHAGPVNLAWQMMAWTIAGLLAQLALGNLMGARK